MTFEVEITDLHGNVLATTRDDRAREGPGGSDPDVFRNYSDLEVPTPLSDYREARVTLPLESVAVPHLYFMGATDAGGNEYLIGALGRMLRIYFTFKTQPIFWDVIWEPVYNADAGTVQIVAQSGPRLRAHFARYADDVVGPSGGPQPDNPLDYTTMRKLVEAAENTPTQNNYPHLGIKPDGVADIITSGSTKKIDRGAPIWEEMIGVHETRYGPDFDIEPRDDLGNVASPDVGDPWPYIAQLNCYERQGVDRSTTTIFRLAEDDPDNNLADAQWTPSGPQTKNNVVIAEQGTEGNEGVRVFGHDLSSWTDTGIWSDWQNPGGDNVGKKNDDALEDLADDIIAAYGRPPNHLLLTTKTQNPDDPQGPVWGQIDGFDIGDRIKVEVDKAGMVVDQVCRITKCTPKQVDRAGNFRVDIECVPTVSSDAARTTGIESD